MASCISRVDQRSLQFTLLQWMRLRMWVAACRVSLTLPSLEHLGHLCMQALLSSFLGDALAAKAPQILHPSDCPLDMGVELVNVDLVGGLS